MDIVDELEIVAKLGVCFGDRRVVRDAVDEIIRLRSELLDARRKFAAVGIKPTAAVSATEEPDGFWLPGGI